MINGGDGTWNEFVHKKAHQFGWWAGGRGADLIGTLYGYVAGWYVE
jgi:hypothetical protein